MLASALLLALVPPDPAGPVLQAQASQEQGPLWIRAERVLLRPGVELADTALLIENGVIVAVGAEVEAPEGARRLEGAVVCPGFVDPWSSLGVEEASVKDLGTAASTRTADAVDPWWLPFQREEALRGGVTSARVQAGRSSLIGGVGSVVRVDAGSEPEVLLGDACVSAAVGVSRNGNRADVFDRHAEVDRLVSLLEKGKRYREQELEYRDELAAWEKEIAEKRKELEDDFKKAKKKRDKEIEEAEEKGKEFKEERYKEDKKPKRPKWAPNDEVMARVVDGELPLVVEVHRASEIRSLLDKTEKYSRLRLVVAGATEAASLAEDLAERRVPVVVWPAPLGRRKNAELQGHDLGLAGQLRAAGVEVLIGSGGGPHARELRLLAALAVSHGLEPEAALHGITLGPAQAFDVRDRVGSLEPGKDADLLVFDGDPLDSTSRITHVVSKGRVVVE